MASATDKLLINRLVKFGIPAADAVKIASFKRVAHQWGKRRGEVEYLYFGTFNFNRTMTGLQIAEHVARCFHNWDRCYLVDTSRLIPAA